MVLNINYDTEKLQKVMYGVIFMTNNDDYVTENTSSKWHHKKFIFKPLY